MKKVFICHSTCTTCKKARKWLQDNQVAAEERDIQTSNPTAEELRSWWKLSGLPLQKLFNTSGQLYRELGLSKKMATLPDEEKLALLASNGMLVKRPVLAGEGIALFGFKQLQWEEALLAKKG